MVFRFLTYIYLWVNSRSCHGSTRSHGNSTNVTKFLLIFTPSGFSWICPPRPESIASICARFCALFSIQFLWCWGINNMRAWLRVSTLAASRDARDEVIASCFTQLNLKQVWALKVQSCNTCCNHQWPACRSASECSHFWIEWIRPSFWPYLALVKLSNGSRVIALSNKQHTSGHYSTVNTTHLAVPEVKDSEPEGS